MNLATWSRASESYTDGEQVNFLAVKYSSRITTKSGDTVTTPQIIFSSGDALRKGNIIKYENTYWQFTTSSAPAIMPKLQPLNCRTK